MTKKHLPVLLLIILLFASCADFLEPIFNNGELVIEAIIPTIGFARDVYISDDFIYIAEDQAGFSIYNKTDNTIINQYYGNIENARDIEALVCDIQQDNSVDILWTHGNSYQYGNYNNIWLGSYAYNFPNAVEGFDIVDTLLFMTGEQRGLYITNRNNGNIISEVNTPGTAIDVKIYGDYAYIADKEYGISVIDISDITQPELVYSYDTSGYAQRIDVEGDYLVVASGGGGVYLFDISDRAKPEFADRWDDSDIGYTYDVDIHNGEVFVATREGVYRMLIIHDK